MSCMDSPLLAVRDLTVRYGRPRHEAIALAGVDLTVQRGETVAIVGESGSGKSTLAHALLGLLPETATIVAGAIVLDGEPVHGRSDREWTALRGSRVALVPQDPGSSLDPLLTIHTQVVEALELQGLLDESAPTPLAVAALSLAGIPDPDRILRLLPHELSGGYRQRVLLAMAMLGEPDLLIADEPTSALDVTVQKTILDRLQVVVAGGRSSLVIITHDLAVAAERADRIVVMRRGRVVESGDAVEVVNDPEHEYTRLLLSSTPSLAAVPRRVPLHDPAPEPLLAVTDLRKTYSSSRGEVEAVRGVSFSLDRGRTLGLVGASGSGKSTVARMINQLVVPTSGSVTLAGVTIAGDNATHNRSLRRRVQLVSQDPYSSLNPRMSVAQIISEPLRAFSLGDRQSRRKRTLALLDDVALHRTLAGRRPNSLSGGQRQRVAIARALALKPDLIVLDEPVSALDVVVQAQILRLLQSLQAEHGVSYLLISHDLAVVSALADTVAVMSDGTVVEEAPRSQIIESPVHPVTQQLIDAVPRMAPRLTTS